MRYVVSVPPGYDGSDGHPLVLALHPGERFPWVGGAFLEEMVLPALYYQTDAFFVAPDTPSPSWSDPSSEQAVVELIRHLMAENAIDPRRVLVMGFSTGGEGAWVLSSRHRELFTAAIVLAASSGDGPVNALAPVPTYVIHSRQDAVTSFEDAAATVEALEALHRSVRFEPLDGVGHFDLEAYIEPLQRGMRWVSERWSD